MTQNTFNDQNYLRDVQYKSSSNLNARAQLHIRFKTNPYGWHQWVFDQMQVPPIARLLELGAGPGWFWTNNLHRIPPGWDITLSDLSAGMVEEQQRALGGRPFSFKVVDAQSIPFDDATFDAVIANHMLYHVPDRNRALSEIRRVLKPGGRMYAATNGLAHLRELHELITQFDPTLWGADSRRTINSFTLENGTAQLARHFADVKIARFDNVLVVTEVQPLVDYILSMVTVPEKIQQQTDDLAAFIAREMAPTGAIRITTEGGVFEAVRR
jgi:SAM-dependent methyltransferase